MPYTRKQNLFGAVMCLLAAPLLGSDTLRFWGAIQAADGPTVGLFLLARKLEVNGAIPVESALGYCIALAVLVLLLAAAAAAFLLKFARGSAEQDFEILKARYKATMEAGEAIVNAGGAQSAKNETGEGR